MKKKVVIRLKDGREYSFMMDEREAHRFAVSAKLVKESVG